MTISGIVLTSSANIGQNGAESDQQFLFECFVDHEALGRLRDTESSAMFALGSTGIGKTALLLMIEKLESNCANLELAEMAMSKISNSDTIAFLRSLDLDLSLFFQALWKHVICIEYIKLLSSARDEDKFRHWKSKIISALFGNRARDKMEHFLNKYSHQFWNTIDENVIEYTENLERGVQAELGAEVSKFQMRAGYTRSLSLEKRVQLQQRAKKFLNPEMLSELAQMISTLSEYTRDRHDKYFILIDKLDENWVEDNIKFQLIAALFESLKGFQKLRNFKVVVALRNDIYERMKGESKPSQRQLEKYEDYIVRIRWRKDQLKEIADRRINLMFRRQYYKSDISFGDIYRERVGGGHSGGDPWKYMVERTLYRPRDIINFINLTLQAAEGKPGVSRNDFKTGEQNYSNLRLKALLDEWAATYPAIPVLLEFLRGRAANFDFKDIAKDDIEELLYLKIGANEDYMADSLWSIVEKSVSRESVVSPSNYGSIVLHRLHLIGAVGLKLDAESSWQWFHQTSRPIAPEAILNTTKVSIHSMLGLALRVT